MITLHQMLHGYKLGHNYIQGSIVLPSSHDMDKIATLSDWSEYVGGDNRRDYITAYPLDESPYYVIAKTWYAKEMRRPGCVWTHSLLIRTDDLGKITDFCNLLSLFEVPSNECFESYSSPKVFVEETKETEIQSSQLDINRVAQVYESLLETYPSFFMTEFSSQISQELILKLLNYVPAEILKTKSVCSGSASPRAYDGKYLSLQFVTHEGNAVKYFTNTTTAQWSLIVGFSVCNNQFQLARLIRHYQDELGNSIDKLVGCLSVVVLINRNCKDKNEQKQVLSEIIITLSKSFPDKDDGSVFKSAVFQPSLARDLFGEEDFLYIFSTVDVSSFTEEQIHYKERLHELPTNQFIDLLKRFYTTEELNEWGEQTVNNVAQFISYVEIAGLLKSDKVLFQTIISSSPALLNQIVWSDFSKGELQSMLSVFSDNKMVIAFKHWRELFKTMFEQRLTIASSLARMAFSRDKECIDEYLDYLNYHHQSQVSVSKELENYPEVVLDWLSNQSSITHDVAFVLVSTIEETSSLVKNKGSEIWIPFYNLLDENDPIQYYVFLYRLSFSWQSQEALAFLRKAFYPIHALLLQDKLEYSLWYRVEPYTERLSLIHYWDRCKKMRKMVIRRLKEVGRPKYDLVNYTPDTQTNEWLLKEW